MAEPPATPPSSDINGVDRDEAKIIARGKSPDPQQQEMLYGTTPGDVARPDYDPEIAPKGNSQ